MYWGLGARGLLGWFELFTAWVGVRVWVWIIAVVVFTLIGYLLSDGLVFDVRSHLLCLLHLLIFAFANRLLNCHKRSKEPVWIIIHGHKVWDVIQLLATRFLCPLFVIWTPIRTIVSGEVVSTSGCDIMVIELDDLVRDGHGGHARVLVTHNIDLKCFNTIIERRLKTQRRGIVRVRLDRLGFKFLLKNFNFLLKVCYLWNELPIFKVSILERLLGSILCSFCLFELNVKLHHHIVNLVEVL